MADQFSFDVVSKLDLQEVENAVHQANKEMQTRFDFKGSVSRVDWDKKESKLTLFSDDEQKLKSVIDIVQANWSSAAFRSKRSTLNPSKNAERATVRQVVALNKHRIGESQRNRAAVKDSKIKVQASIQGDQLRITGKSKDDLQSAIALLKGGDYGLRFNSPITDDRSANLFRRRRPGQSRPGGNWRGALRQPRPGALRNRALHRQHDQ